jgi:hypothetical protein
VLGSGVGAMIFASNCDKDPQKGLSSVPKIHQDVERCNAGASLGQFNMSNEANLTASMSIHHLLN